MRNYAPILWGLGAVSLIGCSDGTPGGPGVNKAKENKPVIGQATETFNLDVPTLSTHVKQGETKSFTIGVKRGSNFMEDIKLMFDDVPTGVTLDPAHPMLKSSEKEVAIKATATDTAALGDFMIKVTGRPTTGADAKVTLKLTVDKK